MAFFCFTFLVNWHLSHNIIKQNSFFSVFCSPLKISVPMNKKIFFFLLLSSKKNSLNE